MEDLVGDGEEEVGEGEGLNAEGGEGAEGAEDAGESVPSVDGGADGSAVPEEVGAPVGVLLEAERPCRALLGCRVDRDTSRGPTGSRPLWTWRLALRSPSVVVLLSPARSIYAHLTPQRH